MSRSIRYRVHEWLADNVSWVQYPGISDAAKPAFGWQYKMPWEYRIIAVLFGSLIILVSIAALAFVAFWLYAFIVS